MELLSCGRQIFLLLVGCCVCLSLAASGGQQQTRKNAVSNSKKGLAACIDDTDCTKALGDKSDKYSCFLYICYPWKDESLVSAADKRKLCRRSKDCGNGQECVRHPDRRAVTKGLCLNEVTDCETAKDCTAGQGCCGGNCCDKKYYDEFKKLPCVSHLGCQDLKLGKFCCPQKNNTDICCDTDPNPTPPPRKSKTTGAAARTMPGQAFAVVMAMLTTAVLGL